jgi:hypothetical protein
MQLSMSSMSALGPGSYQLGQGKFKALWGSVNSDALMGVDQFREKTFSFVYFKPYTSSSPVPKVSWPVAR